ncbi:hypothetical protein HDU84_007981 [Entophlyctis sp. JEL0112]|nr:hypothetical protein HDU84_007981 [Entophlyctis sp. JEL0112]
MARDHIVENETFELIGAYFSPVSSGYQKAGLAYYKHRVRMCQLAVADSDFIDVDPWEARQAETQRTAIVLQHFDEWINGEKAGDDWGVECNGVRRQVKIKLIAGGDLIESFAKYEVRNGEKIPLWLASDLDIILGQFGCFIIERTGADVHDFLLSHQSLYLHRYLPPFQKRNVHVVKQFIYNDISSTKVRLFIKRKMSIKYLLPDLVVDYIQRKNLYSVDEPSGRTDGPFDDDEMNSSDVVHLRQEEPEEKLEGKFVEVVTVDPHEDEEQRLMENMRHQAMNDD